MHLVATITAALRQLRVSFERHRINYSGNYFFTNANRRQTITQLEIYSKNDQTDVSITFSASQPNKQFHFIHVPFWDPQDQRAATPSSKHPKPSELLMYEWIILKDPNWRLFCTHPRRRHLRDPSLPSFFLKKSFTKHKINGTFIHYAPRHVLPIIKADIKRYPPPPLSFLRASVGEEMQKLSFSAAVIS